MGKPTICIGENKVADQLRSNCKADKRLCFRYTDSTIPLLSKSKISSLYPFSVTVQPGLCRTLSEPKLLVFSRTCSNLIYKSLVLFYLCYETLMFSPKTISAKNGKSKIIINESHREKTKFLPVRKQRRRSASQ